MSEPEDLSFPDAPRLDLDDALASLLQQAERVQGAQGRLRSLLRATQTIVEQSDLGPVLRRVVEAAVELVDAEYGALGVIAPDGDGLAEFLHVGLTPEHAQRIGHPPAGRGLLGALTTDPRPIRVTQLADDPRSTGFPANHPHMESFLGVPVRVRGEAFGNLYLTNRRGGPFTDEDEQLVQALATTAGFAIENARLLDQARSRAEWMNTSVDLSAALLSTSSDTSFDLIAGRLLELPGIARVTILLTDEDASRLSLVAARGADEDRLHGLTLEPHTVAAGDVLTDHRTHSYAKSSAAAPDETRVMAAGVLGAAIAAPLRTKDHVWGVITIARDPDAQNFTAIDTHAAADLANRVSVALELGRAREERQRVVLAEDRQRIARDLHDHVIQQLFGTILSLQAASGVMPPGEPRDKVTAAAGQLDDAIAQIRTAIFALSHRDGASVRHRVIDAVAELSLATTRPPSIRFTGPIDHTVEGDLADDLVGVARELLSNAVRHAHAHTISIELGVAEGEAFVRVKDDGIGFSHPPHLRGLENVSQRAAEHGGQFTLTTDDSGTTADWRVALPDPEASDGVTR